MGHGEVVSLAVIYTSRVVRPTSSHEQEVRAMEGALIVLAGIVLLVAHEKWRTR